jgi:Outer membrane protein
MFSLLTARPSPYRARSLLVGALALLLAAASSAPALAQDLSPDTARTLRLSVENALSEARTKSFPVRSADAQRRAATARKRQSLGVFLPQVTAREQGLFTTDPVNAFGSKLRQERFAERDLRLSALNTPDRVDLYGTQLEVQQPILNLDGIFERRAAADAARAAGFKAERTEATVEFRVKKGYYGLLLAERQVGVIDSALAAARANRDQAQALFDEGIINQADRLAAEVRVSELESQRSEAVARRDNAADQLRFLIGLDENVRIEPTDSLTRESVTGGTVSLQTVNQRRSDMRALRARADAAQEKTRARWLAFVPTLNARGTAGWYDDAPFGTGGQSWTAGVSLSWSLFEGFQQIGRAQEAEAQQRRAEIALEQRALENEVELQSARRDLRAARERIAQAQTAVAQAEESLRIRTNRYGEGMARTTDLLQAEATLAERRLAYLRALYQHNVTVYRLELLTEQSRTP